MIILIIMGPAMNIGDPIQLAPAAHIQLLPSIPYTERFQIVTSFPIPPCPDPLDHPLDEAACEDPDSPACAVRNMTLDHHQTTSRVTISFDLPRQPEVRHSPYKMYAAATKGPNASGEPSCADTSIISAADDAPQEPDRQRTAVTSSNTVIGILGITRT